MERNKYYSLKPSWEFMYLNRESTKLMGTEIWDAGNAAKTKSLRRILTSATCCLCALSAPPQISSYSLEILHRSPVVFINRVYPHILFDK